MSFWCLQFPPKNERKQVDLRFHSSKVEFVLSFFGGNVYLKKSFRLFLTFRICLLRFCHLFCKIVRRKPAWAYLKFLIFGAPVSSRTQRTKVRPWSLTGRQGAHTAQLHKIQGNEDVQAQCAVYGLHTPESTW